jgi:hypothetical protein
MQVKGHVPLLDRVWADFVCFQFQFLFLVFLVIYVDGKCRFQCVNYFVYLPFKYIFKIFMNISMNLEAYCFNRSDTKNVQTYGQMDTIFIILFLFSYVISWWIRGMGNGHSFCTRTYCKYFVRKKGHRSSGKTLTCK